MEYIKEVRSSHDLSPHVDVVTLLFPTKNNNTDLLGKNHHQITYIIVIFYVGCNFVYPMLCPEGI